MSFGLLADIASVAALALSVVALWRASTILRRLRERDQQTNLFLNFKQNERILREHLPRADIAEALGFLTTLERCKADAEQLARFRYSKISTEAARLHRRIRRFEAMFWVGRYGSSVRLAEAGLHEREQGRFSSSRTSSVGCRRRGAMLHASKTDAFLDRLIQDTSSGRIRWQRMEPPETPRTDTEEYAGPVYFATIREQRFRLSPLRYRYYTDEDRFEWLDTVALELVDDHDAVLWRFPGTPRISKLLDAVQYASSGIERIIDEVLAGS